MKIASAVFAIALALVSPQGSGRTSPAPSEPSPSYTEALAQLIERSDTIVITEHSYETDVIDQEAGRPMVEKEIVYGARTLTPEQRNQFASRIRGLDSKHRTWADYCISTPHHRLTFQAEGKLLSTMEVCFLCSHIDWNMSRAAPPEGIYREMERLVRSAGLHPDQDWKALAKAALADQSKQDR